MKLHFFILTALIVFSACSKDKPAQESIPDSDYEIISIYPHDFKYFTQGFEFVGDTLVEGTGHEGQSKLLKYNYQTGHVYDQIDLADEYFGEGITVLNSKIYQLTWRNGICFVYNYNSLDGEESFSYTGEGWGLTNDSTNLIMSDGSDKIYFRDPSTFGLIRSISVKTSDGFALNEINELEYDDGIIWANIWGDEFIVSIDPADGTVKNRYDLTGLRSLALEDNPFADVLNGIAVKDGNLFVTGKYWPKIFEIKLLQK